jgi:adenylate cyclase
VAALSAASATATVTHAHGERTPSEMAAPFGLRCAVRRARMEFMSDIGDEAQLREDWIDGLEGEERTQRRRLLARLAAEGFTADELDRAIAEDRLALLPVDRVLGAVYSAREIEQQTGLPARLLIRMRRLSGLAEPGPDERVFSEDDVGAARATKLFIDSGIAEDSINETTAVLGEGMARVTATITAQFLETFLQAGDSEAEVAQRFAMLAEELTPAFVPVLSAAFTAHLRASVARGVVGRAELTSGARAPEQTLAVCFVDMVGFTRLGAQLEVLELGTLAGRLARVASSAAEPPVRLIKTIGDAAMYVSPDSGALVAVALSVLAEAGAEELPSLRAGIAHGPVTERAGDFYGNTVNLASRITGSARPDTVLCTREVRDACPDEFDWSSAGRHRLKGVKGPMALFRARGPATA